MNPKINLNFARDLISTSESRNDPLASVAVLCHLFLDVFQLSLKFSERLTLIDTAINLFKMYEETTHGSNQSHERALCSTSVEHAVESLIVLQEIVTENPDINVERLSSDGVEHFFAATNQRSRNVINITEENIVNTARRYNYASFGDGILFGNRYRDV